MVFALTAIVLTAGFSASPKVLALRGGGISSDQLSGGMANLYLLTGVSGYLAPKKTMEAYGVKEISEAETFWLRAVMVVNIMQGLTMITAGNSDLDAAARMAMFAWAAGPGANIPQLEKLSAPKEGVVGCVAVFGAFAELARRGVIKADLSTNIISGLLLASVMELIPAGQEAVLKGFKFGEEQSPLSKSLFENFSWAKVNTGLFLLVSKLTGKRGLGLAACTASNTLNTLKTLARADKIGVGKGGLIFWSALQGAVALLAFKNEKA